MPHNIGEMFYSGKRPWHELGTKLEQPATAEEAIQQGGLDWEVELIPVATAENPPSPIRQRMAVVRRDRPAGHPGRVVGVVHRNFEPLQNKRGIEIFDKIVGHGERVYHTGGYLGDGERVWILAKLPKEIRLNGHDVVEPYLLFANSHDGSISVDIRLTTIRVVCQNTLSWALQERKAGSKVFKAAHNTADLATLEAGAKEFFKFSMAQCDQAEALFKRLNNKRCLDDEFEKFLLKVMPDPKSPAAKPGSSAFKAWLTRTETRKSERGEVLKIHREGISDRQIPPAESTWWGALNTFTAWVDHVQKTQSDRYAHALLGSGDTFKSQVLELVTKAAAVA